MLTILFTHLSLFKKAGIFFGSPYISTFTQVMTGEVLKSKTTSAIRAVKCIQEGFYDISSNQYAFSRGCGQNRHRLHKGQLQELRSLSLSSRSKTTE